MFFYNVLLGIKENEVARVAIILLSETCFEWAGINSEEIMREQLPEWEWKWKNGWTVRSIDDDQLRAITLDGYWMLHVFGQRFTYRPVEVDDGI